MDMFGNILGENAFLSTLVCFYSEPWAYSVLVLHTAYSGTFLKQQISWCSWTLCICQLWHKDLYIMLSDSKHSSWDQKEFTSRLYLNINTSNRGANRFRKYIFYKINLWNIALFKLNYCIGHGKNVIKYKYALMVL